MADMLSKSMVRRDDTVMVIAGRDKGKTGRVLRVYPAKGKVLVEGANVVKRAMRANPNRQEQGGLVEKESPIAVSNVLVVCGKCSRPTRMSRKRLEDGKPARSCKRCGEMIGKV